MNLNQVTKTMLRDFVDGKISTRKIDLHKEIQATVRERMGSALTILLGDVRELEKHASKFEDLLTEKIHLIGAESVPEWAKRTASVANLICKSHTYFLDEIVNDTMSALRDSKYNKFQCEPLMETFNSLNSDLQPKLKLYRDGLEVLKRELNNAISIEQTGKRAYNALVALGVDMKDLEEVNPNLPTVVKLSVDVCALNGNCEEKSA